MFFIILFLILALIAVLVFAFKLKAVITVDNADISVVVSYLGIIKARKRYVLKREDQTILALYLNTKKGLKPVVTLIDIIKKVRKSVPADIAFVDLLTVLGKSFRKKKDKSVYSYIYRKIKYNIAIDLLIGLEDAFFTAIACGIINGAAGGVLAVYNKEEKTIKIKSYPEYSKLKFSIKSSCIIALAPADIIIGYAIYKKNKRR